MNYMYLKIDDPDNGLTYYFEVDGERVAYRQIELSENGECKLSIAPDFHLSEVLIDFEEEDMIAREEFERAWAAAVQPYQPAWEQAKREYRIGDTVTGGIAMFYPQGVIIQIGPGRYGAARREELASATLPEYLYPGHRADGIVLGYDEDNFWLVLGDVQVSEENIAIEWG
ncbi:hypothetical protein E2R60_00960 [Paenibacillus dendritiformis]|uniref:hypothetical protein n=1 Tax=Paenibacillus dendritiformis TaxID=130049 RepID=UPI0010593D65|nr:hypothetical protein [Paenibacillus dendritiformis]TDL57127.1 hypothetical protein E2R60_00960 [Paenibacillus dendritiformis]